MSLLTSMLKSATVAYKAKDFVKLMDISANAVMMAAMMVGSTNDEKKALAVKLIQDALRHYGITVSDSMVNLAIELAYQIYKNRE